MASLTLTGALAEAREFRAKLERRAKDARMAVELGSQYPLPDEIQRALRDESVKLTTAMLYAELCVKSFSTPSAEDGR